MDDGCKAPKIAPASQLAVKRQFLFKKRRNIFVFGFYLRAAFFCEVALHCTILSSFFLILEKISFFQEETVFRKQKKRGKSIFISLFSLFFWLAPGARVSQIIIPSAAVLFDDAAAAAPRKADSAAGAAQNCKLFYSLQ